jgi:threonine/homoserine/homoserine lactone efflux protein
VDASTWLSLAGICFMGAASPGPSLGVVLANTVGGGRAAGVATGVGHGIGVGIYAALAVAGVAVIVTTAPPLFIGLQLAGAAFLIWMGGRLLRPPPPPDAESPVPAARARKTVGRGFRQGFLVSFLNPKIAVFFLALFSQFVDPEASLVEKGAMGFLAGGIDTAWYVLVALILSGTGLAGWLEARARTFDVAMALVLMLVGVGVLARIAWAPLGG